MTGTAPPKPRSSIKIYKLEVMPIPTHLPMIRMDHPDRIYQHRAGQVPRRG